MQNNKPLRVEEQLRKIIPITTARNLSQPHRDEDDHAETSKFNYSLIQNLKFLDLDLLLHLRLSVYDSTVKNRFINFLNKVW